MTNCNNTKPSRVIFRAVQLTLLRVFMCLSLVIPPIHAQNASGPVIRVTSEIVLTNVTVRDSDGKLIRGLKAGDFTILEDNKPQKIASFDFEDTEAAQSSEPNQETILKTGTPSASNNSPAPAVKVEMKDRRLLVLFFDLTSMQPEEIERAVKSGTEYIDQKMSPADLIAVVTLGNSFQVNLDFTSDRVQLKKVLSSLNLTSGQGFDEGSTGDTEGTSDTGQAFTPDDSEFNIFNIDRRLDALRSLSSMLGGIEQKKSVIYFSSGMNATGIENQSELRAAINDAIKANLSIYTIDVRGLQAVVPGGDAQQASMRGVSAYSGQGMRNSFDSNFSSQESLVSLAADTGGRSFLDTNDLGSVFRGVQQDTAAYYVLGYHSTNPARDGRYRHITVRINTPRAKLSYRPGYYAPRDFKHFNQEDKDRQLEEELASDLPSTDFRVFLSASYFRMRDDKVYSALSMLVPGQDIPFSNAKDSGQATIDISGIVLDKLKRPVGRIRDTVKLSTSETAEVVRKNIQYNSAFTLSPGDYQVKLVLRENQSGKIGSFQSDLNVPDFRAASLKASTIVFSGQKETSSKRQSDNPLTLDGADLVPSVTHVFSMKQSLYLYYEIYDPAKEQQNPEARSITGDSKNSDVRLLSNVIFFRGKVKAYETPLVVKQALNVENRRAAVFQLEIPLSKLQPGLYTCQVNLIDDAGGRFAFRRVPIRLTE